MAEDLDARARDVVRLHARDIDDSELLLEAIELRPYESPTGTRYLDRVGMGPRYSAPGVLRTPTGAKECGSAAVAQKHHRAQEALCGLCRAWSDERHLHTNLEPGSRCGTSAGAQMHRQLGERICEPCRVAEAQRSAQRYAAKRRPAVRGPRPEREPTPRERTVLLLTDLHGVACASGHYVTVAGDDVTACAVGCAKQGWLDLSGDVPVVTEAGRAQLVWKRPKTNKEDK